MGKKKLLYLGITALLIGFAAVSILKKIENRKNYVSTEQNKVRIAYLPVVQALPLYIALEKKYFEKAGLQVEVVKFESPNQIIDALLSRQVDIGAPGSASGITAISQVAKSNSIKIFSLVGGGDDVTNDELLIRNGEDKIQSIKDLKGKKLGILPGIQFRTIAQTILNKNGLHSEKDVQLIELALPLQLQALASNQIDALLTLEPVGTIGEEKKLTKELLHAPIVKFISDPWYGSSGNVTVSYAEKNVGAKKVLSIFEKTIQEINSNPMDARQYLKNYVPLDAEEISKVPLPVFKYYTEFSSSDIISLQNFFDIFQESGVTKNKIEAEKILYK